MSQARQMPIERSALDRLFRPDSVAVIGASPKRGSARNTLVRVLQKHGFEGDIFPVTPSHSEVEGLAAYKSVADLPRVPDLALVITPAETVPDLIAACGLKGIRAAIVYSSGFEEVESGRAVARRLGEAARHGDIAVLGPNCQGLWSLRHRAVLSFSHAAFSAETLKQAPIAILSQSGALSSAMGIYLQRSGVGCSYIVSVGNETCLDALDTLAWIVEQDDVRVVALYLEGLNDAGRLVAIAERARRLGVQIVALKTGRSTVGQAATASHTGKIASAHAVYSDVFRQVGIITVDSLAGLLAATEVLAYIPSPRLSGNPKGGISVLSASGGAGALLADQSEELGVGMAEFGPATMAALEAGLPEFARKANPVDLTGQIYSSPTMFMDACRAIGADRNTEALIVQFASSGPRSIAENGDALKQVAAEERLPMVLSLVAERMSGEVRQDFLEAGVLICDDTALAMRALAWLYESARSRSFEPGSVHPALPTCDPPSGWAATMDYCRQSGITPARWTTLGRDRTAAEACAGLTYPLVVKVLPEDCEHKTELGLVKLRVRSPAEVDAHASDFRAKLGRPDLEVLVQEMVDGGVEIVLACLRNTDFGPVLSIGSGGVAIELYRDVAHLALPTTREQVVAALRRLKLWTLLDGFRGRPPADVDALAEAAVRFGDLFLATPALEEIEINPLIVGVRGTGVVAVDALLKQAAKDRS